MTQDRDSLVARLTESLGILIRDWMTGPKPLDGDALERVIRARIERFIPEAAAALSRPEQVVPPTSERPTSDALPETQGPYEARLCKDIPTDCCDYGVISLSEGREVCRVWREQDARAIAAALASAPASPAIGVQAVTDATAQLALIHSLANDITENNFADKRLYILQTCVRLSDILSALHPAPEAASAGAAKAWRAEVRYGPEGEENYAWVYDGNEMIGTFKTHRARQIVEAMNRPTLSDMAPSPKGVSDGVRAAVKPLTSAIQRIVDENEDFRVGMPGDWAGDPLQDAIEDAHKIAIATLAALSQEPVPAASEERAASKEGA